MIFPGLFPFFSLDEIHLKYGHSSALPAVTSTSLRDKKINDKLKFVDIHVIFENYSQKMTKHILQITIKYWIPTNVSFPYRTCNKSITYAHELPHIKIPCFVNDFIHFLAIT